MAPPLKRALRRSTYQRLAGDLAVSAYSILHETADDVVEEITVQMEAPKHGRWYAGQRTTSSAPGEAPAIQSGALVGSVAAVPIGGSDWEIRITDPKARLLEYGSPAGRIAPRPFLAPALRAAQPGLQRRLRELARRLERGA